MLHVYEKHQNKFFLACNVEATAEMLLGSRQCMCFSEFKQEWMQEATHS